MSRRVGAANVVPGVKERLRLIQVLKDSAAKGDILAAVGLLLVTQSPHARKEIRRDRTLLDR